MPRDRARALGYPALMTTRTRPGMIRACLLGAGALALGWGLAGCGSDGEEVTAAPLAADTGTDAAAETDTTDTGGVDATATEAPVPTPTAPPTPTPSPTAIPISFKTEIQPILEGTCAQCHTGDGPGVDHFAMNQVSEVVAIAPYLGPVVESQAMPPWPASDLGVPLQHVLALSDADRQAIVDWVAAGAPVDVAGTTALAYTGEVLPQPDKDVVMTAEAPYQGSPEKRNDYRCFVLDPGFIETTYLGGIGFTPEYPEIVHHVILSKVSESLRPMAAELAAADPAPGWECFGLSGLERGGGIVDGIGGWVPGQAPVRYPEGASLRMEPGEFLVMQLHYHYDEPNPPADLSTLWLDVLDGPTPNTINSVTYLGPAEIPCTAEQVGPLCDRGAVLADIGQRFGGFAVAIPEFLLLQCGQTAAQYADNNTGVASSSCDLPVQQTGDLIGVFGHMHEYGKAIRLTLNPGTPEETILLDIDRWDFQWQFNYALVTPIPIDRGDTLRVDCTWDRSLVENDPPRYVTWNEGTEDEMCYSSLTVLQPA